MFVHPQHFIFFIALLTVLHVCFREKEEGMALLAFLVYKDHL